MMKTVGRTGDYEVILESMLGVKLKQLAADWHKAMQDAYEPILEKTQAPDTIAKPLFKGTRNNPYNIAPSISPDGKSIVFLSSRDLFSIDLYPGRRRPPARSGGRSSRRPSTPISRASSSSDPPAPGTPRGRSSSSAASPRAGPILTILDMKKDKIVNGRSPSASWARSSARPGRRTAATSPSRPWPEAFRISSFTISRTTS